MDEKNLKVIMFDDERKADTLGKLIQTIQANLES